MNFNGFYGNEPIKAALKAHLFHAYLIEGPVGSGKHTLADLITNALVCDGDNPPCNACRQCYKVRQKCHPDVIDIPSDLPVEDLRQLLSEIVLKPNDATHKIYRIDRAEKMNQAAQNLLLKTLEEPPSYAVFLLLCNTKEGLLPTVRSRCQTLTLAPLSEAFLQGYFTKTFGSYDEKARAAVLLSAGFLGKALEIYRSGEGEQIARCKELESAIRSGDSLSVFQTFHFSDREALVDFYQTFSRYLKRRLRDTNSTETPFYATLIRRWDEAGNAMRTNINVKFWNTNLARICIEAGR